MHEYTLTSPLESSMTEKKTERPSPSKTPSPKDLITLRNAKNGETYKFACSTCINGHRAPLCDPRKHRGKVMFRRPAPGRPARQCGHPKAAQCDCLAKRTLCCMLTPEEWDQVELGLLVSVPMYDSEADLNAAQEPTYQHQDFAPMAGVHAFSALQPAPQHFLPPVPVQATVQVQQTAQQHMVQQMGQHMTQRMAQRMAQQQMGQPFSFLPVMGEVAAPVPYPQTPPLAVSPAPTPYQALGLAPGRQFPCSSCASSDCTCLACPATMQRPGSNGAWAQSCGRTRHLAYRPTTTPAPAPLIVSQPVPTPAMAPQMEEPEETKFNKFFDFSSSSEAPIAMHSWLDDAQESMFEDDGSMTHVDPSLLANNSFA